MNILPYSGFPALPKNIEDMHNQLVTLGLNDVKALTARIKKCEDWVDNVEETELTGNPVEFQNALAVPATSLETTINAIQDLHGLPFPYVGGAYKNKLPLTVANIKAASTAGTWTGNKYAINGVEYELIARDDGTIDSIKVTGTATGAAALVLIRNWELTAGSYILNGCPSGGGAQYRIYTTGVQASDTGEGANLTITNEQITVACSVTDYVIPSGGLIFKPMIRLATETDASFAPYSNICPISGRDSVVLTRSDGDEISEDFTIQLGTTVYGGSLNLTTGVLTIKTKMLTFDGSSDENWGGYDQTQLYGIDSNNIAELLDVKIDTPQSTNNMSGLISNLAKENTQYNSLAKATIAISKWGNINYFYVGTGFTGGTYDLTAFKALLASTPLQVEYPLATPTTIQLTPTQLEMLKGYNRVSIEDGTITLTAYTGAAWEPITRATKKKAKTKKSKKGGN